MVCQALTFCLLIILLLRRDEKLDMCLSLVYFKVWIYISLEFISYICQYPRSAPGLIGSPSVAMLNQCFEQKGSNVRTLHSGGFNLSYHKQVLNMRISGVVIHGLPLDRVIWVLDPRRFCQIEQRGSYAGHRRLQGPRPGHRSLISVTRNSVWFSLERGCLEPTPH